MSWIAKSSSKKRVFHSLTNLSEVDNFEYWNEIGKLTNQFGFSSCHIESFEQNLKLAIILLQKTFRDCRSNLFVGLCLDFSV